MTIPEGGARPSEERFREDHHDEEAQTIFPQNECSFWSAAWADERMATRSKVVLKVGAASGAKASRGVTFRTLGQCVARAIVEKDIWHCVGVGTDGSRTVRLKANERSDRRDRNPIAGV